ncbi:hypothetical protein B0I37DRAFT_440358 [Chaetomium sp. MPI-CAGE-AT-0009]|nr:hypothetical protein B0I37DRAFT_440358 [Chaetomium sp. MPI-CAGE-AT-0009]
MANAIDRTKTVEIHVKEVGERGPAPQRKDDSVQMAAAAAGGTPLHTGRVATQILIYIQETGSEPVFGGTEVEIRGSVTTSGPVLDDINEEEELSAEEKMLKGYQALCYEVGIDPSNSIAECKRYLKNTLVNIVNLIDVRRTDKRVKVWDSFEEFRAYTLLDENRIDIREAKRPPGYLASLLQRLSGPPSREKAMFPRLDGG